MKGFKKCSNGHFYKNDLAQCPHCQKEGNSGNPAVNSGNDEKTGVWEPRGGENADNGKTIIVGEKQSTKNATPKANDAPVDILHTYIVEEIEEESESGGVVVKKELRNKRKLVGWLITHAIDPMGIDYKIYEGKNVIGRNADCNITVNDKTISGEHATILYREADGFAIKDNGSAAGTFLEGKSLGFSNDFHLIYDGNSIKMGDIVFIFKTIF
jgi:hypothetical protein